MTPDRASFLALASEGSGANVVPVTVEILSDLITPVAALATLGADPGSYLLESVVGGEEWARYSFVGFAPDLVVRGKADVFERDVDGQLHREHECDPFARLKEELARYRPPTASLPLPRFWGGAVGYFAYDIVKRFEPTIGVPIERDDDWEFEFALGGTVLIFDRVKGTIKIVYIARTEDADDLGSVYHRAVSALRRVARRLATPVQLQPMSLATASGELPASSFNRESYVDAVERVKEHIRAGDVFQCVLSQRFEVPRAGADPLDVYRAMRVINPSPYMYFLRFGDRVIAGASPETLVRVEEGVAAVRPIAGTRPRGASPEADDALAEELLADEKERSEHVMLVDLGRNDLGRVAARGTVAITDQMVIERYSHVMHIVSNVQCRLGEGASALDAFRATFPAGTLSGAPKVRAMQLIEELEPVSRGVYGGAVGYLGLDGNLDMAIAIRTMVARGETFLLQAGAGIVEASDPELEYEETVHKARAGLLAIATARGAT